SLDHEQDVLKCQRGFVRGWHPPAINHRNNTTAAGGGLAESQPRILETERRLFIAESSRMTLIRVLEVAEDIPRALLSEGISMSPKPSGAVSNTCKAALGFRVPLDTGCLRNKLRRLHLTLT